jgi:hypothetical protein
MQQSAFEKLIVAAGQRELGADEETMRFALCIVRKRHGWKPPPPIKPRQQPPMPRTYAEYEQAFAEKRRKTMHNTIVAIDALTPGISAGELTRRALSVAQKRSWSLSTMAAVVSRQVHDRKLVREVLAVRKPSAEGSASRFSGLGLEVDPRA